jgi:hypothetical protein
MKAKTLALITIYTIATTLFASPMAAQAAVFTFETTLSPASEVPPTNSTGTGIAFVNIDDVAKTLFVDVTFSGLTTGTTASHIHCCAPPGSNAIVATTTPTFAGFPLGVTSGTYFNTLDMTLMSSYNPAFITANGGTIASAQGVLFTGIETGNAYLNIHTTMFGGGEIRGWLVATPLPTALPLFATGLGALGLLGWRRKRKTASA